MKKHNNPAGLFYCPPPQMICAVVYIQLEKSGNIRFFRSQLNIAVGQDFLSIETNNRPHCLFQLMTLLAEYTTRGFRKNSCALSYSCRRISAVWKIRPHEIDRVVYSNPELKAVGLYLKTKVPQS